MLYKVHKLYISYEKEEQWLNEMASKGMMLRNYTFGTYSFEKDIPGKYIYRIELLENIPIHPESVSYIEFMEDTGIEYIGSYMRWVYFRKEASKGPFDLYSDLDSKIKHNERILQLFFIIFLINFMAFILNVSCGIPLAINDHIYYNLIFAGISLTLSIFIAKLALSFKKKIKKLEKEKQLIE